MQVGHVFGQVVIMRCVLRLTLSRDSLAILRMIISKLCQLPTVNIHRANIAIVHVIEYFNVLNYVCKSVCLCKVQTMESNG